MAGRRAGEGVVARVNALLSAALVVMALALFGRIMAYPLQHDEQLFMAAGILLSDGRLYADLGFNHLPNYPWLLSGVFQLTGTDHYLLVARLLTFTFWLAAGAALWCIARDHARSRLVGLVAIILLFGNATLLGSPGVLASNNFAPMTFALWGFYAFLRGVEAAPLRPGLVALGGLLLSLAIGFKANYVFLAIPFAVASLFVPSGLSLPRRLLLVTLPLALGGGIGALPTLYYLLSDPAGFFAHTLYYFTDLHVAHWQGLDVPKVMGIAGKVILAEGIWLSGNILLALTGALAFLLARGLAGAGGWRQPWPIWVALALVLAGMAVSFVPTPAFPHYYVPPIAFILLLFILAFAPLPVAPRRMMVPLLVALGLLGMVGGASRLAPSLFDLVRPAQWTGLRIHAAAAQIAQLSGDEGTRIATLAPLYALEGGRPIYRELSAGPFVYRVAASIPAEQRRHYAAVSPQGLPALLDADPPAAILVGLEGELDDGFTRYAQARGYREVVFPGARAREGDLRLYVRSDGAAVVTPDN